MNILTKSILTLAALAATGLHAEVFPIAEDTFGTISKNTILKASGAAKSVTVSAKTKAYIGFDVGGSGIPASSVTSARLTVYIARASKTGTLYLANATGAFSETFTDKSIPMPTDSIISTIALADSSSREYITFDVTNQVKSWLTTPSSEHGFVLAADGTLAITIATKEGAGTGHPAILEVDVNRGGGPVAGTSGAFTGNVGIGTTTPSIALEVVANAPGEGVARFRNSDSSGFSGFYIDNPSNTAFMGYFGYVPPGAPFFTPDTMQIGAKKDLVFNVYSGSFAERMRIKADSGNVGIGTATPFANLHVQRNMTGSGQESPFRITKGDAFNNIFWMRTFGNGLPVNMELFEGDAFKPGGGSWGVVSDRRLKKDIEPLAGALDKVLQLRSVTYQYKDPAKVGQLPGTQIGFIAQELEEVFPEWITVNADGYKTVNIRGFESLTVQSIRELRAEKDAEIAAVKTELAALKAANTALETGIAARLAKLEAAASTTVTTVTTAPVSNAAIEAK